MKKSLLIIITSMSLIGCGKNAFINSDGLSLINNVESVNLNIYSFTGSSSDGLAGNVSTGFDNQIKSSTGTKSLENFSSFTNGASLALSGTLDGVNFKIEHVDDDGKLGSVKRNLYVENPVSQDGAVGQGSGVDFRYGSLRSKNSMLLTFDKPIGHFGVDLLDFESDSNFTLGLIRAFDCSADSKEIFNNEINFATDNGNSEAHFYGFVTNKKVVCKVIVVVGDDSMGSGFTESFAIDNLRFGSATN